MSPSRPVSLPRRRPLATSPPSVTQRLPVHQPHRRSCRGYRPNGLCRRVRILSWLPTPKLSCRGRRSRPQLITLDVPQGARVSARARGCSPAGSSSHLPPRPFARALPPPPAPEPEPFPTYCFISGPADKYSSIPRGGREVPNNGPASRWPRCAVCTPPGAGGAASIPPAAEPGRGPPSRGELHPFSSLGGPD